jgi:Zn-dependent M16 (insulinase) family peptidase
VALKRDLIGKYLVHNKGVVVLSALSDFKLQAAFFLA